MRDGKAFTKMTELFMKQRNKTRNSVPVERLRELLSYDPETGKFTRKLPTGTRWKPGDEAGWVRKEYVRLLVDGIELSAHRAAWAYVYGVWPDLEIDHIDCNGRNNSITNLREATSSQNKNNKRCYSNTSGFKGVGLHRTGKYRAEIRANGKRMHLGLFENPESAYAAYCEASRKYHGDFSRTTLD